jgi:hypothetical protein
LPESFCLRPARISLLSRFHLFCRTFLVIRTCTASYQYGRNGIRLTVTYFCVILTS